MTPEDLVEIEAIKQVKYRYFRFLDLKQWDEIADAVRAGGHVRVQRRRVLVRGP